MARRFLPSVAAIIFVNALPIIGVLWLGWTVLELMLSYWLETVVICFFTFLKILSSQKPVAREEVEILYDGRRFSFSLVNKGGYAVGFIWNSLGILAVHFVAIWLLFGWSNLAFSFMSRLFAGTAFLPVDVGWPKEWLIFAAALFVSHGYSFFSNYYRRQEYLLYSPKELMVQPYRRVLAMMLVLMVGGWLIQRSDAPVWALVALVFAKIVIDIVAHLEQHRVIRNSAGDDLVTDLARSL